MTTVHIQIYMLVFYQNMKLLLTQHIVSTNNLTKLQITLFHKTAAAWQIFVTQLDTDIPTSILNSTKLYLSILYAI